MKKIIILTAAVMLFTGTIFADSLRGRDVAEKGKIDSVKGTLELNDGEWYVKASGDKYLIHIGPDFYRDEIKLQLKSGKAVIVTGYMYQKSIAPQTISYNGKIYRFRDNNGVPMWSGRGNNRRNSSSNRQGMNKESSRNAGRGRGRK